MTDTLKKYLAERVIEDFRSAKNPSEQVCHDLNFFEYIDFIREQLQKEDVPWIVNRLKNSQGQTLELCINITKPLLPDSDVEEALRSLWLRGHRTLNIVYGLLNIRDLEVMYHREVFEFVKRDWETFISWEMQYDGGPSNALSVARKRLTPGNMPLPKAWIYWCTAAGSDNKVEKKKFFESLEPTHPELSSELNEFRRQVKNFLITKI
jgi:hypothetical protein